MPAITIRNEMTINDIVYEYNNLSANSDIISTISNSDIIQILKSAKFINIFPEGTIRINTVGQAIGLKFANHENTFSLVFSSEAVKLTINKLLHLNNHDNNGCNYSRTKHHELKEIYPNKIILLDAGNKYWSYDEDAIHLGEILNIEIHRNRNNLPGIAFPKTSIIELENLLEATNIPYYIYSSVIPHIEFNEQTNTVHQNINAQQTRAIIGSTVIFEEADGEQNTVTLARPRRTNIRFIDGNGLPASISDRGLTQEQINNGYINIDSALGSALLMSTANSIVTVTNDDGESRNIRIIDITNP